MSTIAMTRTLATKRVTQLRSATTLQAQCNFAAPAENIGSGPAKATSQALSVVMSYIPTEILTVYVPLSAVQAQKKISIHATWMTFGIFFVLSPVLTWALYLLGIKADPA